MANEPLLPVLVLSLWFCSIMFDYSFYVFIIAIVLAFIDFNFFSVHFGLDITGIWICTVHRMNFHERVCDYVSL